MTLSSKDRNAWLARWRNGRNRFHLEQVNPTLLRYVDRLLPGGRGRVLVPLCGKSLDLGWLAEQGHEVLGVELSEKAVSDLFVDLDQNPVISAKGACEAWRSESLEIFVGDLFEVDPSEIGTFDGVWDRAALVALNKADRARYVPWVLDLLKPDGQGLLSTLSYDQTQMEGPPFSVSADEVDSLYHTARTLEQLARVDVAQDSPLLIEAGIDQAFEETWLIGR